MCLGFGIQHRWRSQWSPVNPPHRLPGNSATQVLTTQNSEVLLASREWSATSFPWWIFSPGIQMGPVPWLLAESLFWFKGYLIFKFLENWVLPGFIFYPPQVPLLTVISEFSSFSPSGIISHSISIIASCSAKNGMIYITQLCTSLLPSSQWASDASH